MVINENNAHINAFNGGMNSDTAYDQLKNNFYTFAQNVRITKNLVLGGDLDDYIVDREGVITPILDKLLLKNTIKDDLEILACDSIDNIGVIVGKTKTDNKLIVYKISFTDDNIDTKKIYESKENLAKDISRCSTVLYKELEKVTKLYIATGVYPIISIKIDEPSKVSDINYHISGRIWPVQPVYINNVISGRLKTSQVQYTYRFYNVYGNSTKLAPLTNKIQVIDSNRNREEGNAEDTNTSIGFDIKIDISGLETILEIFERILIFRISYIKPGEDAVVDLIYDDKFHVDSTENKVLSFSDVGSDPLATLTMEEFSLIDGIIILPKLIEQSQQYMFASNIKDDTILTDIYIPTDKNTVLIQEMSDESGITLDKHIEELSETLTYTIPKISNTGSTFANSCIVHFKIPARYFTESLSIKLSLLWLNQKYTGIRLDDGSFIIDAPAYNTDLVVWTIASDSGNKYEELGTSLNVDLKTSELFINYINNNINSSYFILYSSEINIEEGAGYILKENLKLSGTYTIYLDIKSLATPFISNNTISDYNIINYIKDRNINSDLVKDSYKNIFTSSILRSLRRGETYRYAIVYYDKYGRRSDVLPLKDIEVPKISENNYIYVKNGILYAKPLGVKITLPLPYKNGEIVKDIVGCQILRRNSSDIYLKTILQVALARPVSQYLWSSAMENSQDNEGVVKSPYYPLGYLHSGHSVIENFYWNFSGEDNGDNKYNAKTRSVENNKLFQMFSSEIDFRRDDTLSKLSSGKILAVVEDIRCILDKLSSHFSKDAIDPAPTFTVTDDHYPHNNSEYETSYALDIKYENGIQKSSKISSYSIFKFYDSFSGSWASYTVNNIKDVHIPKWYEGFSDVLTDGSNIVGGIKQYKSYTTSIDDMSYNNWISSGRYDLQIYNENQLNVDEDIHEYAYGDNNDKHYKNVQKLYGFIGPGPSCFVCTLDVDNKVEILNPTIFDLETGNKPTFNSAIVNLQHDVLFNTSESEEVQQYYGFGNFFELKYIYEDGKYKYKVKHKGKDLDNTMVVFDGDIYITPLELVTLYKTYDFNDRYASLQSMLVVNYVPMESKVNTYFDYGMNYMNTSSNNLLYEAGEITGITTQERPIHQYNMIYSDNDASNDVYSKIVTDKTDIRDFHQRTYYSEPKENGEPIDNFTKFKAVQFIDADSKYGEITELLEHKNNLFFWQANAFGKFSVNERSLVNDKEGNTIMLGQAGVLSRTDYISTIYGMRDGDMCARSVADNIYWIDIYRKAVLLSNNNQCFNIGEIKNVLNIINSKISEDKPKLDFDVLNDELLCKFLKDGNLLVINTKDNTPTSIYTRDYEDIIYIYGRLYGITKVENNITFNKLNYFTKEQANDLHYLSPLKLGFVVNPNVLITKVFDSQLLCPIKRNSYDGDDVTKYDESYTYSGSYLNNTKFKFETDLSKVEISSMDKRTDREGNIIYNIPRCNHFDDNKDRGNRTRGKWMKVDIEKIDPDKLFSISHIITKFRQSFS